VTFDLNDVNCFAVNTREAGNGHLGVVLSGPQYQRVNNEITTDSKTGVNVVSYTLTSAGLYRADITYNDEVVPGKPSYFCV